MTPEYHIEPIGKSQAVVYWHQFEPMLTRAVEQCDDGYTVENLREDIEDGRLILLGVYDKKGTLHAVATIAFITYGGKDCLDVTNLSGSGFSDWGKVLDRWLMEQAHSHKIDAIMATGRNGWLRMLKNLGYEHVKTTLMKEL